MEIEMGFAEVDDARLYYESAGSGPTVVLVHGFSLDRRMWDAQFAAFAQDYRVVRYDLRGFGRSTLPTARPNSHADDLRALLNHLDIDRAHVVGLSLGGSIATEFALVHPKTTASLVLVDAVISGHQWSAPWDASMDAIGAIARSGDIADAKAQWLAHPLFAPANELPEVARQLQEIVGEWSGWHFTHDNPNVSLRPPAIERLAEIDAPTLIILGARDLSDFHAVAQRAHVAIPHAELITLPEAGHMANMESPAAFNDAVMRFLTTI